MKSSQKIGVGRSALFALILIPPVGSAVYLVAKGVIPVGPFVIGIAATMAGGVGIAYVLQAASRPILVITATRTHLAEAQRMSETLALRYDDLRVVEVIDGKLQDPELMARLVSWQGRLVANSVGVAAFQGANDVVSSAHRGHVPVVQVMTDRDEQPRRRSSKKGPRPSAVNYEAVISSPDDLRNMLAI
ncbi:MAG TPA: hypothetical protein VGL75_06390 [Acidothermaceae bacterium]|jgi:hypothetical protein